MGIIRIIINFLERFDKPAEAETRVRKAPCPIGKNRLALTKEFQETIKILFPNADWFTNRQIRETVGCSGSTASKVLKGLVEEGFVTTNGSPVGSTRMAYKLTKIQPQTQTFKCTKCGAMKKESEFGTRNSKRTLQCKVCRMHTQREYRGLKQAELAAERVIPSMKYKVDLKTGEVKIGKAN